MAARKPPRSLYHKTVELTAHVLKYIRDRKLFASGERVGAAVSGGADSVALLHVLLELRTELGIVPSVVHFNHKIRGAESDADEQFVAGLAARYNLEFFASSGDASAHSKATGASLETAARNLRYAYFDQLLGARKLAAIATAHSLDDQAETVLMRMIRGSGTRGLAGIYPRLQRRAGIIVRPFLNLRRAEVVAYLNSYGHSWRDDKTNLDLKHTRNRVRHKLLPLLELEFNPSIVRVLGDLAEIARGEEEFWAQLTNRATAEVFQKQGASLSALLRNPVAMQRRLLRAAAERAGIKLDFEHIEALRQIAAHPSSTLESRELPNARAVFTGRGAERELRFEPGSQKHKGHAGGDYEYKLPVPGEIKLAETGTVIRVSLVNSCCGGAPGELLSAVPAPLAGGENAAGRYNRAELLDPQAIGPELVVRNWRPGDRYRPAHRRAPKKVKELLQKTTLSERASWPVVASGNEIVWMRGFPPAADFLLKESGSLNGVLIEEL